MPMWWIAVMMDSSLPKFMVPMFSADLAAASEGKLPADMLTFLRQGEPAMSLAREVVAEAEDGKAALAMAKREKPDILMIDIRMPFLNGLELIEKIKEKFQ